MAENEDAPSTPAPEPDDMPDAQFAMLSRMGGNGLRPQNGAYSPGVTDVMAARGLSSFFQTQQPQQPAGMGGSTPPVGPDMSRPSSISYNVHGAPMGGPGGNDRGGWTNVALDANRQPVGSPQSRAQPGQQQTTLAGQPAPNQQAQSAGQSPATSQPQASPLSAPEARNGDPAAAAQAGLMQKPQLPQIPTPVDFDKKAKDMFPHATPMEHMEVVAKMTAAYKPIADQQHRHTEEQLQVYDRQLRWYNAIALGQYRNDKEKTAALAAVRAESSKIVKQASIDFSRSSRANDKLTKELAALGDITPENAESKAAEIKKGTPPNKIGWGGTAPDEARAAQIMRVLDEFKTNHAIMDKAKKAMLGEEALVNGAVHAAKQHHAARPGQPQSSQVSQPSQAPTDDPASTIPRPAAPAAQPQQQAAQGQQQQQPLEAGKTVMDGHVYVGGDPAKKKAWAKLDLDALGVGP